MLLLPNLQRMTRSIYDLARDASCIAGAIVIDAEYRPIKT